MKAYSTRIEYSDDIQDFMDIMGIRYTIEIYENEDLCTIIEDGKPKAWCWEADYYI